MHYVCMLDIDYIIYDLQPTLSDKIVINDKEYSREAGLDFLDLGAGNGGSFELIKKRYKFNRGLAVDIDPRKITLSLQNGIPAIEMDATNLNIFSENSFKCVSIVHVLEHLPSTDLAKAILLESSRVASDFLFIRGPMFYIDFLSSLGLQFYWSNWTGHTLIVEPTDILKMLPTRMTDMSEIKYIKPVLDSSDKCIHALNGLKDRHDYDSTVDPHKHMDIKFNPIIYREFELIIKLH